jgi:hypothetical protein
MVCWLFVGSSIFSAAFALLGGQNLVEQWVLSLNMTPLQFMLLSQFIIFILGWPLEWTEIIVIFMPIFIPLLPQVRRRPAVLRPAGGAQPADGLPLAAGGDGGLLSQGCVAAARDAEPDLRRHDALHGHPGRRPGNCSTSSLKSACGCRKCFTGIERRDEAKGPRRGRSLSRFMPGATGPEIHAGRGRETSLDGST